MALQPDTTIGPYRVTAQIGEGGMGQVYRATGRHMAQRVLLRLLVLVLTTLGPKAADSSWP